MSAIQLSVPTLTEFYLFNFLLLVGSGSFSQSSAFLQGSWENIWTGQLVRYASTQGIKALVHG